jgi:3-keto-5-aminohexanoate cleavage enzyme
LDPLIITSNDPKLEEHPNPIEGMVDEGVAAAEAGAAILHHHLVYRPYQAGKRIEIDVDKSVEVIRRLRKKTDAIFQLGITTATDETRFAVAKAEHVDMMSITLAVNDHHNGIYPTVFRDREDMVRQAKFCLDNGIIPEWEVFHVGAIWNLMYLIKHGYAKPPYWINLTLYPEGSSWSPRTFDEIDSRVRALPPDCIWHLVVFARPHKDPVVPVATPIEHTRLLTHAVLRGGHVRMGKEERIDISPGVPARTNADLIKIIANISEQVGRPPATPDQARRMLHIPANK